MIREEKRWITPEPVELPEFVGEVQEETTASAVAGDLTLDGDERKKPPDTKSPDTEPVEKPVERPVDKPVADPVADPVAEPVAKPVEKPVDKPADKPVAEPVELPDIDPIWQPWGATQPQKPPSLIDKSKPVAPKPLTIIDTTGKSVEDLMRTTGMTAAQLSSAGKDVLSPQQKRDLDKYYEPPEFTKKLSEANKKVSELMEHPVVQFGKNIVEQAAYIGVMSRLFGSSGSTIKQQAPKPTPQPKGSGNVIDIKDYLKAVGK